MSDCSFMFIMLAACIAQTVSGTWLVRNSPGKASRTIAALGTTACDAVGALAIGLVLSERYRPWPTSHGFSCGESRILGLLMIIGAIVLIRAAWRSFNADANPAARAAKLALALLGLALTGFYLGEAVMAHVSFHQVQHQPETHR